MSLYYEDEYVTLYHGDCREIDLWLIANVLVTDPPYGINASRFVGSYRGTGSQTLVSSAIEGDGDTGVRDEALRAWGKRPAIVFGSWRAPRPEGVQHRLIWHKAGALPGPFRAPFMSQDEEIYVLGKGFISTSPPMRSVITTTETRSVVVRDGGGHPTPKPVGLMERLIERCPPGVIADPFAGSGSTLIAARNLGRKVIGVEVEEKYCELIVKRLSQQAFDFTTLETA